MAKKRIETVAEDCKHPDCVYRMILTGVGKFPICAYILYEREPRGCDISKCDRYRQGERRRSQMTSFAWEALLDEDEDEYGFY